MLLDPGDEDDCGDDPALEVGSSESSAYAAAWEFSIE